MHEANVSDWITKNSIDELKLSWAAPWLHLQINRPAQKNALNGDIIKNLKAVFDFVESAKAIRGVVINGGENNFCSGADLQEIAALRASGADALIANNKNYGELLHRIHLCRVPVIAVVDGPALGGGMGLACASDLIFSSNKASFGMPEPKLGIIAGQILPYVHRKLGLVKTQEMALQGLRIKGQESFDWGLSNKVFPSYAELSKGLEALLDNIQGCGPEAIQKTKVMLNELSSIHHTNIEQTAKDVVSATLSAEGAEGGMAFLAKRKPKWNTSEAMES